MRSLSMFALFFFFSFSLAAAETATVRCDSDMKQVPAWTSPGSAYVVEQLNCGQAISVSELERGYFKIQMGQRFAYVDAKYVSAPSIQATPAVEKIQESRIDSPRSFPEKSQATFSDDFPRIEVFGGYAMLKPNLPGDLIKNDEIGSETAEKAGEFILGNILGFGAGMNFNLTRSFGITANFNGFYKSFNADYEDIHVDLDGRLHTFLFGPTFTKRMDKVNIFTRALFGWGRVSATVAGHDDSESVSVDFHKWGFAAAVGGGVDLNVTDRISFRAFEFDYFPYRHSDGTIFTFNNVRWGSGLVVKF